MGQGGNVGFDVALIGDGQHKRLNGRKCIIRVFAPLMTVTVVDVSVYILCHEYKSEDDRIKTTLGWIRLGLFIKKKKKFL